MANEHSQIVPSMQPTAKVADFKFWCQKVLPLVYDDSLSYYEVLNKMVVYLNQVIDNINANIDNIDELEDDFLLLQTYVNNFFDDIDQLVTYTERAEAAETSAISYAANAAESASNAATSAVNAASSSGSAATSALSAMDAKDAAVAAKTAAETALASAQTAATNAAASATAAGNSATAASGSATNAAASATAAQNSFTLADAARTAAQSAASDAEDSAEEAADSADAAAASAASADGAKAQAMIAEEDTATATSTHSVGEFFRMSGNLYVATADIQIGDTITVGTNCRAAVVGEELSGLKTAIVQEVSPNLLDKNVASLRTGLNANTGETFAASGYNTTDYIPVESGEKYTAYCNAINSIQCYYVTRICGYNSNKVFTETLGSISAGSAISTVTIPDGTTYIRAMIGIDHWANDTITFQKTDGVNKPDNLYVYGYVIENTLAKSPYVTKDYVDSNVLNTEHSISYIHEAPEKLDWMKLKATLDNFHRTTDIATGYNSYGVDGVATITNNEAVSTSTSGIRLLSINLNHNQAIGFAGNNTAFAFNIKDIKNFCFIKRYSRGFQLYKRKNGANANNGNAYTNIAFEYPIGFIIVQFSGSKIHFYNDYVYETSIDVNDYYTEEDGKEWFDGTAGMMFIGNENTTFRVFGAVSNIGNEYIIPTISPYQEINNGSSDSLSITNGIIKLLVDKAEGYSDHQNYRSMIRLIRCPYDLSYLKFSCDFKIDESLQGADDYLILQWHDNELSGTGMSPPFAIMVHEDTLEVDSRYSQDIPSENSDCTINPSYNIDEVDFGNWHKLSVELRTGYNADEKPYAKVWYDDVLVYQSTLPIGYKGQGGTNVTFGIYGWYRYWIPEDWGTNSETPFIEFRNVEFIQ